MTDSSKRRATSAEPIYLRPKQIIERYDLSRAQLYWWLEAGDLPSVKLGRTRHVKVADLEKFLSESDVPGRDAPARRDDIVWKSKKPYKRSDGRWSVECQGMSAFGYTKRKSVYGKTPEEALSKLDAIRGIEGERSNGGFNVAEPPLFHEDNPHVYLIQSVLGGPIKIGVAHEVNSRLAAIQIHCPFELKVLHVIEHGGYAIERELHRRLKQYRLHGEWFEETTWLWDAVRNVKFAGQGFD